MGRTAACWEGRGASGPPPPPAPPHTVSELCSWMSQEIRGTERGAYSTPPGASLPPTAIPQNLESQPRPPDGHSRSLEPDTSICPPAHSPHPPAPTARLPLRQRRDDKAETDHLTLWAPAPDSRRRPPGASLGRGQMTTQLCPPAAARKDPAVPGTRENHREHRWGKAGWPVP